MYLTSHWSGLKTNLLSFLISPVTLFLSLSLNHTIQHIYCEECTYSCELCSLVVGQGWF